MSVDVHNGGEWSSRECLRTLYRRKTTLLWAAGLGILAATLLSINGCQHRGAA